MFLVSVNQHGAHINAHGSDHGAHIMGLLPDVPFYKRIYFKLHETDLRTDDEISRNKASQLLDHKRRYFKSVRLAILCKILSSSLF